MMLCQKDQKPAVDCAVANHPSMVAIPGDVDTISRPVLVNIGNIDTMMPEGEVAKLKEVFLKARFHRPRRPFERDGEKATGPSAEACGAIEGNLMPSAQDEACAATIDWFKKHL
jgi:dienelactone hydrolase